MVEVNAVERFHSARINYAAEVKGERVFTPPSFKDQGMKVPGLKLSGLERRALGSETTGLELEVRRRPYSFG
ncbi:MAG: hypothetical protein ABSF53_04845 [Terracidiphilus sp.]